MREKHHKLLNQPQHKTYPIYPHETLSHQLYQDFMRQQEEINMLKEHVRMLNNTPKKKEPEKVIVPPKKEIPKFNIIKHLIDTVEGISGQRSFTAIKPAESVGISEKYRNDYYNEIYKSKNSLTQSKNETMYKTLLNDTTFNGYKVDELILNTSKRY
jgi:hypothetical protein